MSLTKSHEYKYIELVNYGTLEQVENLLKSTQFRKIFLNNALLKAVNEQNLKLSALLLKYGADANARNAEGNNVLIDAIKTNNPVIVKLLINNGANVNFKNDYDQTPLIIAVEMNNAYIVEMLLKVDNRNINVVHNEEEFPLSIATYNNNIEMIRVLLKYGADINLTTNELGRTALNSYLHDLKDVNKNVIELLVKNGAKLNIKDYNGYTPLDVMFSSRLNLKYQDEALEITKLIVGKFHSYFDETTLTFAKKFPLCFDYLSQKLTQQIQKTKKGKQAALGQLSAIPRTQTLSGGRYLYPGGSAYLQAGRQFAQIGRSRGMNVVGVEEEFDYPQGYQQFWRQYKPQKEQGGGPSGNGSYKLRSPRRRVKKSVKKSKKVRKSKY
jgi:ankyrin repeat protein